MKASCARAARASILLGVSELIGRALDMSFRIIVHTNIGADTRMSEKNALKKGEKMYNRVKNLQCSIIISSSFKL